MVALENSELAELYPASSVLLPLLTGLFAVPTLMQSINASIPEQELKLSHAEFTAIVKGSLSGFLVSLFPGVSSGVATAVAAVNEKSREGYIAAMSSANTANALLCFFILISAGKARSGAADAIATVGYIPNYVEIAATSIIAASASAIATLAISRLILSKLRSVKQQNVSLAVLAFLVTIVYFLTGFFGLAIFFAAAPIGIAAVMLGVKRINCMGCLMLPILIRFF